MKRRIAWEDGGDFIAKADKVANELSECVKCDDVYISLAIKNRIFSFGMTETNTNDYHAREHEYADTVCSVTMNKNARQVLHDARQIKEFSTIPYVTSGNIIGYLGQPIRDVETKAIGAICAISRTPRIWSEIDQLNLQLSCMEAEYLLATELMKHEMSFLSLALGEYDNIVMALTNNINLLTSVHGPSGELLFATNALLQEVDASSLEEAFCAHQQEAARRAGADVENAIDENASIQESRDLVLRGGTKPPRLWRATIQTSPGEISFVSWKPGGELRQA